MAFLYCCLSLSLQSFIGQKYGPTRLPSSVPVKELDEIKTALEAEGKDTSLLDAWYQADLNIRPNLYRLQQPEKPGKLSARNLSGSGCSTQKTSLVDVSLKLQTLISQICQYFLLKKCVKLLQCKSFSNFFNKKYQCI